MFAIDQKTYADLLQSIQETCIRRGFTLATAESCTGGLVAALLTHASGSSAIFKGGIVAYSNSIKTALLDVPEQEIIRYGAVSVEVARSMAQGARRRLGVDFALSITGIAGPGGGSVDKPLGTVCCGWSHAGETKAQRFQFNGDRETIRAAACAASLQGLRALLKAEA